MSPGGELKGRKRWRSREEVKSGGARRVAVGYVPRADDDKSKAKRRLTKIAGCDTIIKVSRTGDDASRAWVGPQGPPAQAGPLIDNWIEHARNAKVNFGFKQERSSILTRLPLAGASRRSGANFA